MYRITTLVTAILLVSVLGVTAERIKRKPPDEADRARLASEQVLNDGDLRTGDIISTDRGFFQLRGLNVDGSYDLAPVRNPLSRVKAKGQMIGRPSAGRGVTRSPLHSDYSRGQPTIVCTVGHEWSF
jgi:hypothetical protein